MSEKYPSAPHEPVEVEVAYVPTEDAGAAESLNPLGKLHRALKGRYPLALTLALILGSGAAYVSWRSEDLYFQATGQVNVDASVQGVIQQGQTLGQRQFDMYMSRQRELVTSAAVIGRALRDPAWTNINAVEPSPAAVAEFARHIVIDQPRTASYFKVGFQHPQARTAQIGLEALIKAYKATHDEQELGDESGRVRLLNQRRDELTSKHDTLVAQIRELGSEFGSDTLTPVYQSKLAALAQLEIKLRAAEAAAAAQQGGGAVSLQEIAAVDPDMATLLKARDDRSMQLAQALSRYGDNHPFVLRQREDMAAIQAAIDARLDARKSLLPADGQQTADPFQVEVARLRMEAEAMRQETTRLGQINLRIGDLQAEAARTMRLLEETTRRIDVLNTELPTVTTRVSYSIGNPPTKPANVRTRQTKAALGGLGGMMLGLGMVASLSLLNRKYRYSEDASSSFGDITLLGILPTLPDDLADPEQAATATHSVHHIRGILQVSSAGQGDQHILAVTSSVSGTGKTSLALALGMSFASSNARTLLIDFDLFGGNLTERVNTITRRRIGSVLLNKNLITRDKLDEALLISQQMQRRLGEVLVEQGLVTPEQLEEALRFQEQSQVGLLDCLAGEALEHCAGQTAVPNLWILPTGGATGKHAGQLSPQIVRRLIDQARRQYDAVIVDTGPVPGSLEASLVSAAVDGVVFVVSRGEQRSVAERAIEHLQSIHAPIAGVVFNRADPNDFELSSYSLRSRVGSDDGENPLTSAMGKPTKSASRFGPIAGAVAAYMPNGQGPHGSREPGKHNPHRG